MWQDHIPVLFERFENLKQQRLRGEDPKVELVLRKYEEFCFEMLEGVRTLLLELIGGQAYVRKRYPHMELRMYLEIHTGIMAKIVACGSESLNTIPKFHYELMELMEQVRGYCLLLKQDIKDAFSRYARLQRDRKFRQINLIAKQTIEAISRLQEKTALLSKLVGGQQAHDAIMFAAGIAVDDFDEILDSGCFTDAEKAILAGSSRKNQLPI